MGHLGEGALRSFTKGNVNIADRSQADIMEQAGNILFTYIWMIQT